MKLEFLGADHEVTGSCHYLKVGQTHVLIDCGMEQEQIYMSIRRYPSMLQKSIMC